MTFSLPGASLAASSRTVCASAVMPGPSGLVPLGQPERDEDRKKRNQRIYSWKTEGVQLGALQDIAHVLNTNGLSIDYCYFEL